MNVPAGEQMGAESLTSENSMAKNKVKLENLILVRGFLFILVLKKMDFCQFLDQFISFFAKQFFVTYSLNIMFPDDPSRVKSRREIRDFPTFNKLPSINPLKGTSKGKYY